MARKKKIGLQERVKILEESYKLGCNITELARKHKISSGVLYRWRAKNKKSNDENGVVLSDPSTESIADNSSRFVEVTVSDARIEREGNRTRSVLQKASLEYENFTITVEGNRGMRVLSEIMKVTGTVI